MRDDAAACLLSWIVCSVARPGVALHPVGTRPQWTRSAGGPVTVTLRSRMGLGSRAPLNASQRGRTPLRLSPRGTPERLPVPVSGLNRTRAGGFFSRLRQLELTRSVIFNSRPSSAVHCSSHPSRIRMQGSVTVHCGSSHVRFSRITLPTTLMRQARPILVRKGLGRLGVYGPILGRLPLRVFSIGKYAFQKKSWCECCGICTLHRS